MVTFKHRAYAGIFGLIVVIILSGCQTGVEPSPDPGILRVTLKSNELDTTIIIQNDTSRFSRWDEFNLFVYGGKVYRGINYAYLYRDRSIDRIAADTINILKRERLNGNPITPTDYDDINTKNSRYVKYVIFESYVPPGNYDSLSFALTANQLSIFVPKVYTNPVQLPPDENPQMQIPAHITVKEGRVTEVNLEILPFSSLYRYRDSYFFKRKVSIVSINNM